MALVSFFMCAKTDEEARARADGATFFQFALRFYGASQNRQRPAPGTVNMWDEYNKWKRENPQAQEAALRGGLIGSPETIAQKLQHLPVQPCKAASSSAGGSTIIMWPRGGAAATVGQG